MEDDACSLILPNCQHTDLQNEKLESNNISREPEMLSGGTQSASSSDEASEQATGIVMVTLPESSDEYQTPPEHHLYSQNSSNDGLAPATETEPVDQETEIVDLQDGDTMVLDDSYEPNEKTVVDLTNDNDKLEFLEKSKETEIVDVQDGDTMVLDDTYEPNEKRVVDLTKDTDNLEFLEKSTVLEDNNGCAGKVFDEMPMREQVSSTEVDTSNVDPKGKRGLPFSLNGTTENKHGGFLDTMNRALKILKMEGKGGVGGDDDDDDDRNCDFLETAMRRGLTFPRPRWWPPEGGSED